MSFPIPVQLTVAENNVPVSVAITGQEQLVPIGVATQITRCITDEEWQSLMNEKADIIISSANGVTASFPDGANNLPAVSLLAEISSAQDLHGYSKPWPAGGGTNLFPDALPANAFAGTISSAGVVGTATNSIAFSIPCEKNTDYTFTKNTTGGWTGLAFADSEPQIGDTVDYRGSMSSRLKWTQNSGNHTYIVFVVGSVSAFNELVTTKEAMTVKGSTEQPYSPYKNICPITGSTGLSVYVSPTQDQQDATEYAEDWSSVAGTVYGGTINVVTGVLTVYKANIAAYNGETLVGPWLSSMDEYSAGATPTTGAQVVYTLSTPITYQLTAQEVKTILGQNYAWSSNGAGVSITYRADTKLYIDNKIAQAVAAALNAVPVEPENNAD